MKNKLIIVIAVCFLIAHTALLTLTDYSLTGFWTDIIVVWICSVAIIWNAIDLIKLKSLIFKILAILILTLAVIIVFLSNNIFFLDHLKLTSFSFHYIQGRFFHTYFKPVGAYSGGEGNFWISESPKLFPLIEKQVYYEHAIDWDFRWSEFDGETVDQRKTSEACIIHNVIETKNH